MSSPSIRDDMDRSLTIDPLSIEHHFNFFAIVELAGAFLAHSSNAILSFS